jgi:hypothetical protein
MAKAVNKAKAVKKGTSQNMQKGMTMNDKLAAAERAATGAAYQLKVNKFKGKAKSPAMDYKPSKTAAQRTKDLNKANDTSKTLGRAKNIVSKEAAKVKNRKDILAGKAKYINK